MKVRAFYTDESTEDFDSIPKAQDGIAETVCGCDFAATLDALYEINEDGDVLHNKPLQASWSVSITEPAPDEVL